MSTINPTSSNAFANAAGSSSQASAASQASANDQALSAALNGKQALTQGDFLKLLVTQVQNQDPTKPMDSTQFVSQLAQFSSLAGITSLNTTMTGVSNSMQTSQLLQGTALVGQDVLAPGSVADLTSTTPLMGAVTLPASSNGVTVKIADTSGNVVQSINLGSQQAGNVSFSWDGMQANGKTAPVGTYQISASYLQNNQPVNATTLVAARVNSVALGSSGLSLELQNIGTMNLSQVSMIL